MEKLLFNSARRPEKARLFRKTPRCTSLAISSVGPGLDRPRAARRSWNDRYVSNMVLRKPFVCGGAMMSEGGGVRGEASTASFSKGGAAIAGSGLKGGRPT